jgi:sec-independent protein translocase protein TatA
MFGNLGMGEMIFIGVIVLLVFGAKRLPEIGASMGKGIREFKKSINEVTGELQAPPPTQQYVPPQQPQQYAVPQPPQQYVAPPQAPQQYAAPQAPQQYSAPQQPQPYGTPAPPTPAAPAAPQDETQLPPRPPQV